MGRNIGATLSLNSGNFFSGVKGAVSSLDELKTAVTATNSAARKLGGDNELEKWKNKISAAKVEVSQAKSALAAVKAEQEKANAAFATAKSRVNEIKVEQEQLNQQIKNGTLSTEQAAKKQEQLNQKMAQAKNEVDKTKTAQVAVKSKIDLANAAISVSKARQAEVNVKYKLGEANIEKEKLEQKLLNNEIENSERKQKNLNAAYQRGFTEQKKINSISKASSLPGGNLLSGLGGKIAAIGGAYAAIEAGKKVLDISDEMASTSARIKNVNDGLQSNEELNKMIFQSAKSSRGEYQATADLVTRLGSNAKAAFSGTSEIVSFAEQINKRFVIAGASTEEAKNATLQLSQALASGTLRGDELNSVLEQAPNIARSIETYMGASEGSIKELASQGLITSEVVKNAILSTANETNATFEKMPMTFSQMLTNIKNTALEGSQSLLGIITSIFNGGDGGDISGATNQFTAMINGGINSIANAAPRVLEVIGALLSSVGTVLPGIADKLLTSVSSMLPQIVTIAGSVVVSLATGLGQELPILIPTIVNGITNAVTSIAEQIPQFVIAGMQLVTGLAGGLINAIPQLISAIPTIFTSLINGLMTNLPQLVVSGVQMIVQLAVGLITGIPQMIAAIPRMFIEFANSLIHMDWAKLGKDIWQGIKDGFTGKSNSDSKSIGTSINNSISNGISSTAGITNTATYNLGIGATNNLALGTSGMSAVGRNGVNNYTSALSGGQLGANTAGFSVGQSATSGLTFGSSGAGSIGSNVVDDFNNNILAKRLNGHAAGFSVGQSTVQGVSAGTNEMSVAGQATVQKFSAGIQNNMGTATNAANQLAMQTAAAGATNISSTVTVTTTGIPEVDSQLQSLGNTGQSVGDKIKSAYTSAMSDIKAKTNEAIIVIKSAFEKMQIVIPKPKIPVINVAEVSTQVGTQQVKIPKFDVQWNAAGGIFTRPTVLATSAGYQGFGEAGAEAVLPLETFWQNLRKYINESRGGKQNNNNKTENHNEINLNVYTENKSTNQFANELAKKIIEILKNM